ncbi:venom carboxylesterase-6-like [Euwallacea similis]|uniref:venom carboxylesterase-6-like n=1 Tax=Euwallacea similis TaxID=1736056 RepID=UPI00344B55AC
MKYILIVALFIAISTLKWASTDDCVDCSGLVVNCEDGKIRGKYLKTRQGREISAFLGIPFAKPPVGDLRFKPPVPFGGWQGILNATQVHSVCPQRDIYRRSEIFEGEEDCLYLNVYVPKVASKVKSSQSSSLPVMVFFHGGGWLCGSGNTHWYGPDVLLERDVILVVLNYRLGALGFLTTGDEVVPGNNGLKDQNLGLKWVQKNIKYFGGDPKSVTLFGESAGGASVHYHMLSPMSRDLFHKAIAMSGTSLCIWACSPKNEGVENAKKLAKSFDCPTDSSKDMIKCLSKIDALDIVKHDVVFMEWDFDPMIPFKPTIEPNLEGAFLAEHPVEIIKSGRSAEIPLIVGITSEDGALRAAAVLNNKTLMDDLNRNFETLAPISLMYDKTALDVGSTTRQIKDYYFRGHTIDWSHKTQLVNMYTDGWFLNCADETVQLHVNYTKQPVYYYLFGHKGEASFTTIFGGGDIDYGVCHADDLQYLFPVADSLFPDKSMSDDDKCVTTLFTTLFSNFAFTGDPTPKISDLIPERWHPTTSDNMEYYFIHAQMPGLRKGLFLDRAKFWRSLNSNPRKSSQKSVTNREEL